MIDRDLRDTCFVRRATEFITYKYHKGKSRRCWKIVGGVLVFFREFLLHPLLGVNHVPSSVASFPQKSGKRGCFFPCRVVPLQSQPHAPLAQLDRASGYGPEGRGFESLTACQNSRYRFCGIGSFVIQGGIRNELRSCASAANSKTGSDTPVGCRVSEKRIPHGPTTAFYQPSRKSSKRRKRLRSGVWQQTVRWTVCAVRVESLTPYLLTACR